jgi:hypothetical protein
VLHERTVTTETQLREKLRKIEALFAGAATHGERSAAQAAMLRVRGRIADMRASEGASEIQFTLSDTWSRKLFLALARRYGLEPYRYPRQRQTTVILRTSRAFIDLVLWPEFRELNETLRSYLNEVTLRVIREEVHADTADAIELS